MDGDDAMKRRGFLQALAGLAAVPNVANAADLRILGNEKHEIRILDEETHELLPNISIEKAETRADLTFTSEGDYRWGYDVGDEELVLQSHNGTGWRDAFGKTTT